MSLELQMFLLVLTKLPQGQTLVLEYALVLSNQIFSYTFQLSTNWLVAGVLSTVKKKPTHWQRYIDEAFAIWPHGQQTLQDFFQHINGIHGNI